MMMRNAAANRARTAAAKRRQQRMNGVMPEPDDDEEEPPKPGVMEQLKDGLFVHNPKLYSTLLYLVFVLAFWFVLTRTQGGRTSFDLVQSLRGTLSGYMEVTDSASWFEFMEGTFPAVVFPVEYYNGEGYADEDLGNVADHFMLVGAVGIRQVRTKNNTCDLKKKDMIFPMVKNCFGEYSPGTEDREPYGPEVEPGTDRTFKYSTALDLGCKVGCSTVGNLGIEYGGGGFFEILPSERAAETNAAVIEKIAQLKQDRWIDRQTRAIFVDFTVYSLPSKLMAVVQLWYECKASGKVSVWIQVLPLKVHHLYMSEADLMDMLAEFIMIFLTFVYTGVALRNWCRQGCLGYWSSGWNVFDMLNYVFMFAAFGSRYAAVLNAADIKFPPPDDQFLYLSAPAAWVKLYKYLLGLNSIFTFLKILKYLSHIPMFARLVKILGACVEDVAAFVINCGICLFAFAGALHLTYGNHMFEFATPGESFMTLFRYSMGDWDIPLLQSYQPDFGLFIFMMWTLLAICLLLNMFIGIIMESYDKVNQEEEKVSLASFIKAKLAAPQEQAVVVSNDKDPDEKEAEEGEGGEGGAGGGAAETHASTHKIRDDVELILAALVDFRRDMKALNKKVQQITDTDGNHKHMPTLTKHHPGFLE